MKSWWRSKRLACCTCLLVLLAAVARGQDEVRFSVLGLFHPGEIVLEQAGPQIVSVSSPNQSFVLNGEAAHRRLAFRAVDGQVLANGEAASLWNATGRGGGPVLFRLVVPGRIRREYRGKLAIEGRRGELLLVVSMDLESAVASIVDSEMNPQAPMEALKAQAVVSRSFLAAGSRHAGYDFCDTTHCQFLRSPPASHAPATLAAEATRGLILAYRRKPLAAMYSSRCGGETHSLRDLGMDPGRDYPYYPVECAYCRQHPFRWQSRLDGNDSAPAAKNEQERIRKARQWGWSFLRGGDFTAKPDASGWLIEGKSVGHGIGMCQVGAIGMAAAGADFRTILKHYYPNSEIAAAP